MLKNKPSMIMIKRSRLDAHGFSTGTYTGNGGIQTIYNSEPICENETLSSILGIDITKEEILDILRKDYPEKLI